MPATLPCNVSQRLSWAHSGDSIAMTSLTPIIVVTADDGAPGIVALASVDLMGRESFGVVAVRLCVYAVDGEVHVNSAQRRRKSLKLGNFNELSLAGLGAVLKRSQDCPDSCGGGDVIRVAELGASGHDAVRMAPDMAKSAETENLLAVRGEVVGGADEAEAGHLHGDDVRLDLPQLVVAEAHAVHYARAPVVDDNVGLGGKSEGDLKAFRILSIDGDAALVAI